jgi:hypothetical protein
MDIKNAFDSVLASALGDLLEECGAAIKALERAEAWPSAARLKEKLRWYQEVQKTILRDTPNRQSSL